jgi:hypothetical protein
MNRTNPLDTAFGKLISLAERCGPLVGARDNGISPE